MYTEIAVGCEQLHTCRTMRERLLRTQLMPGPTFFKSDALPSVKTPSHQERWLGGPHYPTETHDQHHTCHPELSSGATRLHALVTRSPNGATFHRAGYSVPLPRLDRHTHCGVPDRAVRKFTSNAALRAQCDRKPTKHQLPAASSGAAGSATTEDLQRITALLLGSCCLTRPSDEHNLRAHVVSKLALDRSLDTHRSASR
jgi:hypothetical protein